MPAVELPVQDRSISLVETGVALRYGTLALTLASGQYAWQYIQVGGAVADSGVESCH